jgi:hypothetical protein
MRDDEYTNKLTGETRRIPIEPADLEPWERAGIDDLANGATKHLPEDGSRWCRANRYAVVYSALCSLYRLNKKKSPPAK